MLEADESCTPDIVEDNYAAQVMSTSLEYFGHYDVFVICSKIVFQQHFNQSGAVLENMLLKIVNLLKSFILDM